MTYFINRILKLNIGDYEMANMIGAIFGLTFGVIVLANGRSR